MVRRINTPLRSRQRLSVLALSSRFDGPQPTQDRIGYERLSVLALSSRFDGLSIPISGQRCSVLSVLALSSRFDGQLAAARRRNRRHLSVLALSSRFDGLTQWQYFTNIVKNFQYSLCRVVLMVMITNKRTTG